MKQKIHTKTTIDIESGLVLEDEFFWYDGPLQLSKASQEQKDAAKSNQEFTETLRSQFQSQFKDATKIQADLTGRLDTIVNNASNGQGYTPATLAALNTNNVEANATQSNNAVQALNRQIVQQSNGAAVPTGASAQLRAQILANGAASTATGQRNILTQNAQLANSNLFAGTTQLGALSGQLQSGSTSLAGTASSNGAQSYNEIAQAYQPSNFWGNLATGALTAAGTALATPLGGAVGNIFKPKTSQISTSGYIPGGMENV